MVNVAVDVIVFVIIIINHRQQHCNTIMNYVLNHHLVQ